MLQNYNESLENVDCELKTSTVKRPVEKLIFSQKPGI